ncbi:MAG: OstA-like protein [Ginsengibacter sp.]
MFVRVKFLGLLFFLIVGYQSYSQVAPQAPPKDTLREFQIIRGPSMRAIRIDSATTLQTIAGGAIIQQGSTIFHSDSAVVNPVTHIMEAFGNIEINQADTVHTYSQYLKYLGVEKIAYLKNKVKLVNKSGTLFTDDLDYNLQSGIGNFHNGGKIIEGKSVITSVEGTYYDDTRDIIFKKNVKLDEPKMHIRADSLMYNMQTKQTTFISQTYIKTPEIEANTTQGTYDVNTKNAFFSTRSTVKDSSGRLYTANTMAIENKSGNAQMEGNAVIIDSAGGYTIIANQIFMNKKNNSFLATRKPVLILKQKNDSTYIAADTIYSGFTTFVNNTNKVLKNASTINVNIEENQKVHETITNDSTAQFFLKRQQEESDAAREIQEEKDSLKNTPSQDLQDNERRAKGRPHLKDSVEREIIPPKHLIDSVQKKLKENEIDSLKIKDSLHKEVAFERLKKDMLLKKDTLLRKDSLQKEPDLKKPAADSLQTDSSKILPENLSENNKDSLGIALDSINKSDTSIRYFLAFHHVKIFNDSLQSISDSMFISSKDSVFRLYYSPVLWSGNTQIAGDTMFLYTKNKQPLRLYVFEKGLIVNRTKEGFFNQMSGKTINGYFVDGKIDYMRVKGTQSESIYYIQNDDSAYIGMNRATGDVIDLYFKNSDLNKVLFINNIDGKLYPMNQIPEDQKKLKDFKWLDDKRPKNRAELFE